MLKGRPTRGRMATPTRKDAAFSGYSLRQVLRTCAGLPERVLALRRGFPRPASGVQAPRPSGGETEPSHFCIAKMKGSPQRVGQTERAPHKGVPFLFGLPERIRTFDLQSRSLTRYPAVPRVDAIRCGGLPLVDPKGIEPSTSALRTQRSPS